MSKSEMTITGLDAATLRDLQSWQGRSEQVEDEISTAPLLGLSATLDHDMSSLANLTRVPPLGHWLYFLPRQPQREIGSDGHAKRGGFLPPVPLPRRMWAGGQLHWDTSNPLRVGDRVHRTSTIESIQHKSGRSGDLVFVQVKHQIGNERGIAITELHDIVYRPLAQPSDPTPQPILADTDASWDRDITPDPVLLFRYSALTFNGHRIHYDRSYVTNVEGYPGLVVHGPLIATLLLDLIQRNMPTATVKSFVFKAVRPTFDLNSFRVNGRIEQDGQTVSLWANDHEGFLTMKAQAAIA